MFGGVSIFFFFFQAEDGIRDLYVTGVQTCALPILAGAFRGYGCPQDFFALESHVDEVAAALGEEDRKSTRLNSSHVEISYAVFCLKKKKRQDTKNQKLSQKKNNIQ